MHSDDFERFMFSWAEAGMIRLDTAQKAVDAYRESRRRVEREQAEKLARYERKSDKPFTRLLLVEDPVLGVPVVFLAILVVAVISWLV